MISISDDEDFPGQPSLSPLDSVPPAVVKCSYQYLLNFGYCPDHPERVFQRAWSLKHSLAISSMAGELYELSLAGGTFTHHYVTVDSREVQQACFQVRVLSRGLENIKKFGAIINSLHYAKSFADTPLWTPAYDNLIVQLALRHGLKLFPAYLKNYKPLKEWIHCAYPENPLRDSTDQRLSQFCLQRLRFLIYCLVMSLKHAWLT